MRPSSRRQNVVQAWAGTTKLKATKRAARMGLRTGRNRAGMLKSSSPSLRKNGPAGFDHLGVKSSARLGRTALGFEINVNDAEALRIPVAPLEVVEQGPGEVTTQVDALPHRLAGGREVRPQIAHAERIGQLVPLDRRGIVEGGSVFGDIERNVAVPRLDPDQRVGEPRWEDFPVHFGVGMAGLAHPAGAHGQGLRIVAGDVSSVVVDA